LEVQIAKKMKLEIQRERKRIASSKQNIKLSKHKKRKGADVLFVISGPLAFQTKVNPARNLWGGNHGMGGSCHEKGDLQF
jgi:hypothetical protein